MFPRSTDSGATWATSYLGTSLVEFQPFIMTQIIPGTPAKTAIFAHWNVFTDYTLPAFDVFARESVDGGLTWQSTHRSSSPV